ncbi:SRPBCC family protein [Paenibacillus cellulositrophicus]|uniref:SRPBCC family protein n=1 Tax=Paenibacillus TaxID=44249 RepID=UPI0011A6267A|nr:SRPBCC family protein [Paenibacillus sp. Y412MC10]
MLTFEYVETYEHPASVVFSHLINLQDRGAWINGIMETQVSPEGPARIGTKYFESGKYSGFKSEKNMVVTELIPDRQLTLETTPDEKQSFRESYRIEPLSDQSCRVHFTLQVGNVPKVAEFFMRQSMKKEQPQNAARLKAVLAG